MYPISFDLDGVLYDSEPLVRQAYAEVGITLTDEEWITHAWGRPWEQWLTLRFSDAYVARRFHEAKNNVYRRLVREDTRPRTSAAQLALEIALDDVVYIHTSASVVAANIVCAKLGFPGAISAGLTRDEKVAMTQGFIHIDDDPAVTTSCERGIHYVGQPLSKLREQVIWMQSS